jgi:preprotein translocase SecE subunit
MAAASRTISLSISTDVFDIGTTISDAGVPPPKDGRDNEGVEPLPAGARMPPSPPRPPAPPTTGGLDRSGGSPLRPPAGEPPRPTIVEFLRQCRSEFRKVVWPSGRSIRSNATVVLFTVIMAVVGLGMLELAVGWLAGDALL